jgi:hypothetical protein
MSEPQAFFDFHPHQFNPFTVRNLQFYHVYDGLSQTPYIPSLGIEAGDPNIYFIRYCHRITVHSIAKHLDWKQREPTSFISLFDDRECAIRESHRRASRRQVYDPATGQYRNRGDVRIAIISGEQLALQDVFIFSTEDLISERMLGLSGLHPLRGKLSMKEWFVMDYIPQIAVVGTMHTF